MFWKSYYISLFLHSPESRSVASAVIAVFKGKLIAFMAKHTTEVKAFTPFAPLGFLIDGHEQVIERMFPLTGDVVAFSVALGSGMSHCPSIKTR